MKNKSSRRKFIATAITGTAASIVAPKALAGKQHERQTGILSPEKATDTTSKRATVSEFIIFPWSAMPEPRDSNLPTNHWGDYPGSMDDMMHGLYECGFNTSGFINAQYLKDARNNHLMGILKNTERIGTETQEEADQKIKTQMESITDPEDRKAVYVISLVDEPPASSFPILNIWSKAVKKQNVLPYINLFPDYASPQQLGTKNYEEHLDQYVDICNPPYISYDNYSLYEGGRLDEDRFFGNIEAIRKKTLQAGIPFWNIILGNTHFRYAEPSDATLAIQVYSTLAYGGRGIGYFTYFTPHIGNYRLAPIDRFGFRTKTWEMVRYINLQIHSLIPVYSKLKSVNVFHTGTVPRNGQGVDSAKLVESVKGDTLLVGEFTDNAGKPYAMVVNKNVHSSIAFDIQFKEKGQIMIVSQFNQGMFHYRGEQVWLAPGNGTLLTVEN